MAQRTNTQRIADLENKVESIDSKLDMILGALNQTNGKSDVKEAPSNKVTYATKSEAVSAWKAENGITEESAKKYGKYAQETRAYLKERAKATGKYVARKTYIKVVNEVATEKAAGSKKLIKTLVEEKLA